MLISALSCVQGVTRVSSRSRAPRPLQQHESEKQEGGSAAKAEARSLWQQVPVLLPGLAAQSPLAAQDKPDSLLPQLS